MKLEEYFEQTTSLDIDCLRSTNISIQNTIVFSLKTVDKLLSVGSYNGVGVIYRRIL